MIVFNLACDRAHEFEGWFASAGDMAEQRERGLLACPQCGSVAIEKKPSAPRLNLSSGQEGAAPASHAMIDPREERLKELVRQVLAGTEDVGQRFPEEARRIYYREAPARSIRGVASRQEADALAEEGIEVAQLPFPVVPKSELN